MVPGIVPLLDGMFGSMGGYLGPWMRTLTLWVERGRGCLSSPGFCGGLFRPLSFVLLCVGFLLVVV